MADSATRKYLIIWAWLAGLMLLGVFVSEAPILPVSKAIIVGLVLVLSAVKASLVALHYMHLQSDRRLLAFIALAPFLLLLAVLGLLSSHYLVHL